MKRCILSATAAIGAFAAFATTVPLKPGETLDWATDKPGDSDTIEASGGTIINLKGDVKQIFNLTGPVTVKVAQGATPRLRGKIFRKSREGQMTFSSPIEVGGTATGGYALVEDGALAFEDGATLKFPQSAYTGVFSFPESWPGLDASRVTYSKSSVLVLYGVDMMTSGTFVTPVPSNGEGEAFVRITSATNFGKNVTIQIPEHSCATFTAMKYTPSTGSGSTLTSNIAVALTNDIELVGGRFKAGSDVTSTSFYGDFTGSGEVEVENSKTGKEHYFNGSLSGLDAASLLTLDSVSNGKEKDNYQTRVTTGFPGTIVFGGSTTSNIVSFGVKAHGKKTVQTYNFGAIESAGQVTATEDSTFYGPLLQYNKLQTWKVGKLSGEVAVSPSQNEEPSILEVDEVADNAQIWIRYGMTLKLNKVGEGVVIRYAPKSDVQSNVIEIGEGVLEKVEFLGGDNTVTVTGGDIREIRGTGTIIYAGSSNCFGVVDDTVDVKVASGKLRFGSSTDLGSVVAAKSPVLWLDASATTRMAGAWNTKWAASDAGKAVLAENPKATFNGADSATFKGSVLIEKWFDRRADQNLNYGWQYRNYKYSNTLYTLVYPYLVENGLNGKPYMSFGSMGGEMDTAKYGLGGASSSEPDTYKQEFRRMQLMQGMRTDDPESFEGHAVTVRTAVMVFGSQNGGGRGVLGGYSGNTNSVSGSPNGRKDRGVLDTTHDPSCSANFVRGRASSSTTAATPIFDNSNNLKTWLDGESICPTNTGFSGGWQILAFNGSRPARSLGMSTRYIYAGGQNYAEILIFTNTLVAVERQAVEEYLAVKWNMPTASRKQAKDGNVEVAKGALVCGALTGEVAGEGTVVVQTETGHELKSGLSLVSDGTALSPTLTGYGTLTLPQHLTIDVDLSAGLPLGDYDIVSAETLTGAETLTVNMTGSRKSCTVRKVGNRLVLTVSNKGMTIFVK